ncbi:MAG TPA: helix-turn-helix transcriptional regulator [Dehalococcoidia bacterium]|nr:helix-turn-helix transcriptional regulator [Dehalococcoidia bacterium]
MLVVTRPQQLGTVVLAARLKVGMTQQTLAYLAGTTPDAISAIEKGTRKPEWPTLARIAAVLQIPASSLDSAIEFEVAAARKPQPENPKTDKALKDQRERMRKRHLER